MVVQLVRLVATVLAVAGVLMLAGSASAQEGPKPTKEHDFLKRLTGSWDATVQLYMEPGKPPAESKGTETNTLGVGGMWLIQDFRSTMFGQPFQGHGVLGYDPAKKKYVGTWVDSMSDYVMPSEGTLDETGKKFTQTAQGKDMTGKMTQYKMVMEFKDKDTHTFTMSLPGEDGRDVVNMVITYRRKK